MTRGISDEAGKQAMQRAFRDALGSFATGVTIATTIDATGQPVGVTASSFNSVSMEPPLVLWSLAKNSLSRDAFASSGHFAVHVLAAMQEELSNRFARSGADKFAGLDWSPGQLGSPLLTEHAALFECRTRHQYDGGDHIIMVGEVVAFDARGSDPLIFHGGRYAESRPLAGSEDATDEPLTNLLERVRETLGDGAEEKLAAHMTSGEIAEAKRLLRRILEASG